MEKVPLGLEGKVAEDGVVEVGCHLGEGIVELVEDPVVGSDGDLPKGDTSIAGGVGDVGEEGLEVGVVEGAGEEFGGNLWRRCRRPGLGFVEGEADGGGLAGEEGGGGGDVVWRADDMRVVPIGSN